MDLEKNGEGEVDFGGRSRTLAERCHERHAIRQITKTG